MPSYRYRAIASGVAGSPAYITFYATMTADGTAQDFVDGVEDYLNVANNYMYNAVILTGDSQVIRFDPATGEQTGAISVTPFTMTATGGLSLLPPATQCLATLRTTIFDTGRLVRGRINLPYFSEDHNGTDGRVSSAVLTALNNAAGIFLTSTTVDWSVWSRKLGNLFPVSAVAHEPKWAVLRSRRD